VLAYVSEAHLRLYALQHALHMPLPSSSADQETWLRPTTKGIVPSSNHLTGVFEGLTEASNVPVSVYGAPDA